MLARLEADAEFESSPNPLQIFADQIAEVKSGKKATVYCWPRAVLTDS
jgi:hypothetical protein